MSDPIPAPLGYDYFADASGARSLAHSSEVAIRFQTQRRSLERLTQTVAQMPLRLARLEEAGAALPEALRGEVSALAERLAAAAARAEAAMAAAQARLEPEVEALIAQVQRNDDAVAGSSYEAHAAAIVAAKATADDLRLRVEVAENDILATFSEEGNEVRGTEKRLHALEGAVERLRDSDVSLQPGERLHAAAPARLLLSRAEPQAGTLFLTDRRLLFEQREEITRRGRLLPIPRREQVQQVTLDIPRAAIVGSKIARAPGALSLHLNPPTPAAEVRLELHGAEPTWLALLGDDAP